MLLHGILHNIHSLTICTYPKGKINGYFMSMTLYKSPFFLYYMYNEWVTSTDDFSMKEATFNLKLADCMQKTCSNLNPRLPINRSNALICDFYWWLSHILIVNDLFIDVWKCDQNVRVSGQMWYFQDKMSSMCLDKCNIAQTKCSGTF